MSTAEQMSETAHVVDYDATPTGAPECVDDCPGCADAALSPTLRALRDIIAALPGWSGDALAAARYQLAAHARELGELVKQRIEVDRAENPGGGQMAARNHTRRGGMMTARWVLERYADDLDATGGGS